MSSPPGPGAGPPREWAERLLAACFFVSGATSLVLEVAWTRQLAYVLGSTLYAVSTVVAAYLAGLALGAHLASTFLRGLARPFLAFAWIQLAIGLYGACSIPLLRATPPLFEALYATAGDRPGALLLARFAVVFALMLVPTTLMGTTLPIVAGAWGRGAVRSGSGSGLVYGLNTLGAVCGTLLAGYALIPSLGLANTCLAVGVADACVGAAAWALHRAPWRTQAARIPIQERAAPAPARPGFGRQDAVAALYLLSGFAAIALEVVWFRYLAYVFGPTSDAFAVMLATYLAGIGLGSLAGAALERRVEDPLVALALLECAAGTAVFATALGLDRLPELYMALYWQLPTGAGDLSAALAQGISAALVVLPATLALGALFPLAVRAFVGFSGSEASTEGAVGRLYAWNTLGGILGSLATGFVLLPRLGLWRALALAAVANLAIGLGFSSLSTRLAPARRRVAAGAAAAFALAMAAWAPRPDALRLNSGMAFAFLERRVDVAGVRARDAHRAILYYREGINASVAVTANDTGMGHLALWVSGKAEASTETSSRVHLSLLGHLPVLFAESPRRVAVVGFGAGISTAAVLASPLVESVDVLEIEPAVIEASRYFALTNGDPLSDPRVRVRIEDGRTYLAYAPATWDVITTDPISPVMSGAASLYTSDFYALVARKLAPDGVFCQWFETWIPSEETYRGMLASLQEVFPHVVLFFGRDNTVVLASRSPIERPWEEFRARFEVPRVREQLAAIEIDSPLHLLGWFAAGDATLRRYAAGATVNRDDRNGLERQMASDMRRPEKAPLDAALFERFRVERLRDLRATVPGVPLEELARLAGRPAGRPLGPPPGKVWREFLDFYAGEGESDTLARLRAWREASPPPPRAADSYLSLLQDADRTRAVGDERAEEAALRALLRFPDASLYYRAGVRLGELLASQGRSEDALALLQKIESECPALPDAFQREAEILRGQGRPEEALEAVVRGLLFNPHDPSLLALRADLSTQARRHDGEVPNP